MCTWKVVLYQVSLDHELKQVFIVFASASTKKDYPVLKTTDYLFKGAREIREFDVIVFFDLLHCYISRDASHNSSFFHTLKSETPLRSIPVDTDLREQLLSTGKFSIMSQGVDEREHSGEMQYPFIAKVLKDLEDQNMSEHDNPEVKVLPIMVGSIKIRSEVDYGKLLAPYLSQENIFTVVSSDFCHWGDRFSYTPMPPRDRNDVINEVYEYIEYLDRKGMDLIQLQRPGAFADYLRESSNTICGRHPISVWLNSVIANKEAGKETINVRFVKYDQSEKARSKKDFSVSYASAVARLLSSDS